MEAEIDARGLQDDPELLASVKDSLRRQVTPRQILEVRKQIDERRSRNRAKALELRRSSENQKAGLILQTLALRKEANEARNKLQEQKIAWRCEMMRVVFALQVRIRQNHEAFFEESKRAKVVALQSVLSYLNFDAVPLVLRNLRSSSRLLKAVEERKDAQEEETTNDRAPESCERCEDETERVTLEDTPKVTLSHAILTDDIRAAISEVMDDKTERSPSETKLQTRLARLRSQIESYIHGERLCSKSRIPSETLPVFDASSYEKSSSRDDLLDELSCQSGLSSVTLMLTKSASTEVRQISVLALTDDEFEQKLAAMSPISKPVCLESDPSGLLSLSSSHVDSSRRSLSLILTSPRENESLCVPRLSPPLAADSEQPVAQGHRTVASSPIRQRRRRWRRWLCGCICSQ